MRVDKVYSIQRFIDPAIVLDDSTSTSTVAVASKQRRPFLFDERANAAVNPSTRVFPSARLSLSPWSGVYVSISIA